MKKSLTVKCLWGFPLLIYAVDVNAWGLFTHIYFAQHLAFATPMLDPRFRKAIKRFPQLVMAGACLPDLALISKQFKGTHYWSQANQLMRQAETEQELAIAIGYHHHLFVDIIAHNHFVPTFEAKWLHHSSMATHVIAEWAMDAHIKPHLMNRPFKLLRDKQLIQTACRLLSVSFGVDPKQVKQAIRRLAWADKTLRFSQLSTFLLKMIKRKDDEFTPKLHYYLQQTHDSFSQFEQVLKGETPAIRAELNHLSATEMSIWREKCLIDARLRLTSPLHLYRAHDDHLFKAAYPFDMSLMPND